MTLRRNKPSSVSKLAQQLQGNAEFAKKLTESVLGPSTEQMRRLTESLVGRIQIADGILGRLRIVDPLATLVKQLERQNRQIHEQIQGWMAAGDRALRKSEPDVRLLAKCGWTIPMWGPLDFCVRVMDAAGRDFPNPVKIDAAFEEHYTRRNGALFNEVAAELLSSEGLAHWRLLLTECLSAYRRNEFNVPVPALFTILEGAAIAIAGAPSRKEPVRPMVAAAEEATDVMDLLVRVSLYEFLRELFASSDFTTDEPVRTNRHWVLHGRSRRPFTRVDCLRLLHALHTLSHESAPTVPMKKRLRSR